MTASDCNTSLKTATQLIISNLFLNKIKPTERFPPTPLHCIDRGNHILILNTIPTLALSLNLNTTLTLTLILRGMGRYFTIDCTDDSSSFTSITNMAEPGRLFILCQARLVTKASNITKYNVSIPMAKLSLAYSCHSLSATDKITKERTLW